MAPIRIFLSPEVRAVPPAPDAGFPALSPIAVLAIPDTNVPNPSAPTATFKLPVPASTSSELYPTDTLSLPLLAFRAPLPIAVVLAPVVLFNND